jgi:hypothetical protein
VLTETEDKNGRSTIMQRRLPGGTLTFAYPAPRLFRRIPVKFLFCDETDAGEATGDEGNPIALATCRRSSTNSCAVDATSYAVAVKALIGQPVDAREAELATRSAPKPVLRVARSAWMDR